jgi:hypothetical protein
MAKFLVYLGFGLDGQQLELPIEVEAPETASESLLGDSAKVKFVETFNTDHISVTDITVEAIRQLKV